MSASKTLQAICFLICVAQNQAFCQPARTPFSAFGIGDIYGNSLINQQGMAGTGISQPQYWYLNHQNPALLVFNRLTVFHAGFAGERKTITSSSASEKSGDGNLLYLMLGFPLVANKWVTSAGLMPFSSVNYLFSATDTVAGTNTEVQNIEDGNGGFNQAFWSNGFRITNDFSLGLRASYLFSSIVNNHANTVNLADQLYKYTINVNEHLSVSDFKFTGGFSFHKDSVHLPVFRRDTLRLPKAQRKKYNFNFGATYELAVDGNGTFSQKSERRNSAGNILQSDSIANIPTKIPFPHILKLGVSMSDSRNRWSIASDVAFTWPRTTEATVGLDSYKLRNAFRVSLGSEFTPDQNDLTSFLKRFTYRTGVSYETSPYLVNGAALKDFGINFGLSVPVSRISSLDLAVRLGKRGDKSINSIEEKYFKLYFGITFNDQWFIKRRYD